ncbi:probable C-mannosyltransferase DPY19L3 isoform X1 [Brienomyrus brachyistius]|uniref:probable C-mannosyltransferase DPY19L3 isoform X1 n=2 Tax=Brienomyrus brachyistius TaxID=42636 RepID=UPI0020B2C310|nr:probable C-mannosyltransferase DPY19L3 isoform X1 [Brienomyrus brachyistius]
MKTGSASKQRRFLGVRAGESDVRERSAHSATGGTIRCGGMSTLRQRKDVKRKDLGQERQIPDSREDHAKRTQTSLQTWWTGIWVAFGVVLGVSLGLLNCIYVATLHENDLWFSNIKEVEREISFRTECGLYYSYYKQMIQASSIEQGLFELIYDNKTESRRTINVLQRMNIYQEVFLSILYRLLSVQEYLDPIYFYIYTVFSLQALYATSLYATSWLLSDSWLAGALTASWYILNRIDTTRVEFTISLRENWSLPFFALQVASITYYLRPQLKPLQERAALLLVFLSTLWFSLTWQFNQFILLVQALGLFVLDCLDLISPDKVTHLYIIQLSSLLVVWLLQFCNPMLLGSLAVSFLISTLLVRRFQAGLKRGGPLSQLARLVLGGLLVLVLTFTINFLTKKSLQLRSDEHIYKFVKAKFGLGSTRDFDAKLYLCEEAFGLLPLDTFDRLAGTLVLYPYLCTTSVLLAVLLFVALRNLIGSQSEADQHKLGLRPDVSYNLLHTVLFGLLAYSTMRMKYLWTGHMCAFAAYGLCGRELWGICLRTLRCHTPAKLRLIRYAAPISVLIFLYFKFWPKVMEELSELREFYDPDTVELMTWISSKTPEGAVFAGSMQLLAGIKLCTGRSLTNHPHYEDQALRERTREVYQIYARQPPGDVYRTLQAVGADYVVLEDSICYERRHRRGCRLRDLLDVANGHIMDDAGENEPDLIEAPHPRFCVAIKADDPAYTRLFKRVFQNKTFHVYKLRKRKPRAVGGSTGADV